MSLATAIGREDSRLIAKCVVAAGNHDDARRAEARRSNAAYCRSLLIARSSAAAPLPPHRTRNASTPAVSSSENRWSRVCGEALMRL